jgi:dTDP-4-amino-4,6-dideoxygalactose transaminase
MTDSQRAAHTHRRASRIPLVDLAWQHRQIRAELNQAFVQLVEDAVCDGVAFCHRLEAEMRQYAGPEFHAVSVQSGSAAEFLALKALGIGPGDEVITVPNSDMATTAAISHSGAAFVLVDIDPQTHNIDPAQIESAITPRTRAILPVHMYGLPAPMDAIGAIAQAHGLCVVEDATLALGASYRGKKVGVWGDAAFFSFAPRKVIGGMGNGGMVLTRHADVAYRVRLLKGYGQDPSFGERPIVDRLLASGAESLAEGYNLKMDPLHAAVTSAKFAYLEAWAALRQKAADTYAERLTVVAGVRPPMVPSHSRHAWRNYVVTVPAEQRPAVRAHLQACGIDSTILYTPPVHLQPVYRRLGLGPGSFPAAEAVAGRLLGLPMHPGLCSGEIDAVVAALGDVLNSESTLKERA